MADPVKINLYQYITKDEYINSGGTPIDESLSDSKTIDTDYKNILESASSEINWLSGNRIGPNLDEIKDYISPITGKVLVKADLRKKYVKKATLIIAGNLIDRGFKFLRGSASLTIGSNFSTSQTNPQEPDYIPPMVIRLLMNAHFYNQVIGQRLLEGKKNLPTFDPNTGKIIFPSGWLSLEEIKGVIYRSFGTMVLPGNDISFKIDSNKMTITINGETATIHFKTGENVSEVNIGIESDPKSLITQEILSRIQNLLNTAISNNTTNITTNTTNIGDNLTKINTNKTNITNLENNKLNKNCGNAEIDTTYVNQYLKVGTNGEIIFDTPSGGGGDDCAKKDLSNILKPKQPIANMITSQANELGDDTTSEVKINTIYTDLKVNGRGVFVNGNRIDSSMEWKDITNTWQTRNWSKDDVGKQVRITTDHALGHIMSATLMWDNLMMEMVFCYQFFSTDAIGQRINYGYWRSSYVGRDNVISTSMLWNATTTSPLVNVRGSEPGWSEITKFEIFENVNVPEPKLTLTLENYKQYTTWDNIGGLIINDRIQQISNVFMRGYIPDPTKPTQTEVIFDLTLPNQLEVIEANAFFSAKINSLIIPDNTVAIGDSAFTEANILSLTLGNSVISIGDNAFSHSSMGDLSIPNSVVNIGDFAFQHALIKKLRLDLNVKTIGNNAFEASPLEELHIGFQVEKIGDLAFWSIVNAPKTKVYLPIKFNNDDTKDRIFGENNWDQITFILPTLILDNTNYQKYSIYNKDKKLLQIFRPVTEITDIFQNGYPDGSGGNLPIEILSLPNTLVKINDEAFNKARLSNLFLPRTLTSIGENAFRETRTRTLTLPDSLTDIGIRAFYNNRNTILDIGTGLKNLGVGAFIFCQATSLVFPNGIKSIGNWCFANAPLTNIVVPNSINTIGGKAFKSVVNASTTTVSLPRRFNKKSTKDSLFDSHWNNITFTWT